ncbi:MAG: OmpA family protein [candidate division WOR-3 bacterium]
MIKKLLSFACILCVLAGGLKAQSGFFYTNKYFLTEDPEISNFGTIEVEPMRTMISFGSDDSTTYVLYNIYNGLRVNLMDILELGVCFPFYIDHMTRNNLSYFSRGKGDFLINLKYRYDPLQNFSFALSPYISIPFGRARIYNLDSLKNDTMFAGGFLRDFTSTSYDYGLKVIAGYKKANFTFNFNYGYFSAYRHQLSTNPPDFHFFGFSAVYKYLLLNPFAEIAFGKFTKNTFGKAPSYFSLGTNIHIMPILEGKIAFAIPLSQREPISMVIPDVSTSYPGFLGSFANFPENFVLNFGVKFKNIVYNYRSTSRVTVIVKDRATEDFVENCRVKIGPQEYFCTSGVIYIPAVKAGVRHLKVVADGYMDIDKFVEIQGNTATKIEIFMVRKELPVLIFVKNIRQEPVDKAVALISAEEGTNNVYADSRGLIVFNLDREKPLSVYVSAPGYIGENFYLEPTIERDTIKIDVILKEEKDEVAVLPIIYFDVGSYKIRKEFFPFLDIVGRYLVNHPDYKLEIIGHASAEGPERFNQVLSVRRAEECKKHLVLRYKIDPGRIITKGFGKDVPAVPNKTEYQRSINRRAEFRLIPPEK